MDLFTAESGAIVHEHLILGAHSTEDDPHIIRLEAANLQRTARGVTGQIRILMNNTILGWSDLNLSRDDEREKLANSAMNHISVNGIHEDYPKSYLKHDLDIFCDEVWTNRLQNMAPTKRGGYKTRKGPTFILRPFVVDNGGTVIFGPPGRGKSNVALTIAVSIDAGIERFWPVQQTNVLFINLERSEDSLRERLGNINEALGLDREREILMLNARGQSLIDVEDACRYAIRTHKIGLVILDSISRAGLGTMVGDEPANLLADMLTRICPTWLALAHTPKGNEDTLYGSQMYVAAADVTVKLFSQQDPGKPLGVGLDLDKKNDVGSAPMQIIAFEFDELGVTGIRPGRKGEFPEVEERKKRTLIDDVVEAFRERNGPMSATDIEKASGRSRNQVSNALNNNPETFVKLGRQGGHAVLYGLVGHGPEPLV